MNKITVIGAGNVGSTIAYTLSVMGLAKDIVMIDINNKLALGEALDIRHGTPFSNNCTIYAGNYEDAAGSNIVILTCGVARKPGQSRLELAQINVDITKTIIPQITKYAPDAMYIIVSNPVDILTYQFFKTSGLPEKHIIVKPGKQRCKFTQLFASGCLSNFFFHGITLPLCLYYIF